MTLREAATDMKDELARLRHRLHAEPELGLKLPRTQEKVLGALDGLPLEVSTGKGLSSVTAVLRGTQPGPVVLLRGDMDALPVTERGNGVVSRIPGRMHACGHDLHTTMLAGAARLLSDSRDSLAGSVVFMFQPGEEGAGGARIMLDEGVLDAAGERPVAAYALHVASSVVPQGMFVTRPGPIMAAADRLRVTVRGVGGHGANPHLARDPLPAACEMVLALQTAVTRRVDIFDPAVLTIGQMQAGTTDNVIGDEVFFQGTIRSFSARTQAVMKDASVEVIRGIASAHGLEVEVDYQVDYPLTVNDEAEAEVVARTVREVYGEEKFFTAPRPFSGSEDFSFVGQEIPSAFVSLGACPGDRDPSRAPYNHSPDAAFSDEVLADGAALYAELAVRRLSESIS
ncbi:M20 family metallopeptidase [Rhodococcus erythropolis]|uniref:M20 metallopeptidase family protein n=1 Tax=Rhodococcus erythropolis TaxID=1833 RepID=UPI002949215B|nr:M20 family metallopeptidase [Rhodococcus erythropolis]MDV6277782.1 M20 family metallopeptidase [Rhodococcus erythropolis]